MYFFFLLKLTTQPRDTNLKIIQFPFLLTWGEDLRFFYSGDKRKLKLKLRHPPTHSTPLFLHQLTYYIICMSSLSSLSCFVCFFFLVWFVNFRRPLILWSCGRTPPPPRAPFRTPSPRPSLSSAYQTLMYAISICTGHTHTVIAGSHLRRFRSTKSQLFHQNVIIVCHGFVLYVMRDL